MRLDNKGTSSPKGEREGIKIEGFGRCCIPPNPFKSFPPPFIKHPNRVN